MHSLEKMGPAPIYEDKPWEHIPYFGNAISIILHNPAEGIFRTVPQQHAPLCTQDGSKKSTLTYATKH